MWGLQCGLRELVVLLNKQNSFVSKKWMKFHEVRRLLKISSITLQTFKNTGIIPHTKIGGIIFYDHDDIQKLLESGKVRKV